MRIFATRGCAAGASGPENASQASELPIKRALCFSAVPAERRRSGAKVEGVCFGHNHDHRKPAPSLQRPPWNKRRLIGQKSPLKLKDVWIIRMRLQLEGPQQCVTAIASGAWQSIAHAADAEFFRAADTPVDD
jgi:hypothetical protein